MPTPSPQAAPDSQFCDMDYYVTAYMQSSGATSKQVPSPHLPPSPPPPPLSHPLPAPLQNLYCVFNCWLMLPTKHHHLRREIKNTIPTAPISNRSAHQGTKHQPKLSPSFLNVLDLMVLQSAFFICWYACWPREPTPTQSVQALANQPYNALCACPRIVEDVDPQHIPMSNQPTGSQSLCLPATIILRF